jgi:hypothetical protein
MDVDYFIPDNENQTAGFSQDEMGRLREFLFIQCVTEIII